MKKIAFIFKNQKFVYPLLFLFVCILSYGILIPTLGLYWDGWPYMWQYHAIGPAGFPEFVASDRPHSAWIFMLLTWLFGYRIWAYHIAALIFRWLSVLFIWWSLNILWPSKVKLNSIVALLFAVYPGFLQQPISLPYCHHLSHMAMFFFSIWGMLFAIRNPKKYWWLIMLSSFSSMIVNFSLEYFTTLELIRPLLIWIALNEIQFNGRLKKTFQYWLPYLISLVVFLVWRIFIFKFPTYEPRLLQESTEIATTSGNIFLRVLKDLNTVSFQAWGKIFNFPNRSDFGITATIVYWCLIIFAFISILVIYHLYLETKDTSKKKNENLYALQLIALGLSSMILAGSIYWALNLTILTEFAWDRLNLSFILGVSFLLFGLIIFLVKPDFLRIILFSVLICLAIGFHFRNTMSFKRDWEHFQNFFWQLTWRAPDLKPGTIILTTDFPLRFYSDNSLTAPLNWIYDPNNHTHQLNYLFYYTDVRLKNQRLPALEKDIQINQPYRSFYFTGNTNQSLVLRYSPPACVHLMDSIYANAGVLPNLSDLEAAAIPLSNLNQVNTDPLESKHPPIEIMSLEPTHDWCYYFEKADLARQKNDWLEIEQLGIVVESKSLKPRDPSEWLPFIESYIKLGKWEKVIELTDESLKISNKYLSGLCKTWRRIHNDAKTDIEMKDHIANLQAEYNCP